MKKYLITSFFVLLLILNVNAQPGVPGQYFQAQIKQSGSDLQFILRPNPASNGGSNIANFKFDNLDFFIRYPLTDPLATFGSPVVNTTDFPGLIMTQDIFGPEAYGSEAGFRIVEWTSPFGNSTSTALTYNAGQEYIVFTVPVTNFSTNFQFSADNINGAPYFLTLTRNTATIGGFADYSAQGPGGSSSTHLFYGPPANLSSVGTSYYQTVVTAGTSASDHFRSITSGNWNSPGTWESSSVADFTSGVINPATLSPDNTANVISIRNTHTVTVTANVSTDQTFVNPGGTLVVNGSTLTVVNDGLTIQSSAAGTGRIGTSTGTITGNATVERFINDAGKRAWRLLSGKSVGGSQTIFNSWQEGGAVTANKGVWMTSGSTVLPGFDGSSINGASILIHDQTIPSWTSIPVANTNATALSARQGYMLFVRGDRNYTAANSPTYNTTVLKATGTLNQGNQPAATVSATGSGRTLVGNPYASSIDVDPIFLGNATLDQAMYVWDATLSGNFGVGGFKLVERNGGVYQQTPVVLGGGAVPDANSRYIHSGQAFLLKATGANANVVITESMKTASVSVVNPIVNTPGDQQLFVNLMVKNNNNVISLADGIRVRFDGAYNSNTSDDYVKMGNFDENISSFREGKKLIVEKRPMIVSKDTIFLRITNTGVKDYQFQIGTFDFVQTNASAFVEDSWLNTSTPINLRSITDINFSVTSDPASANQDRFKIVFATAGPLPVTFTNVKAQQQVKDILVEWKVSNQLNIAQYEVEKSIDGLNFSKVNAQASILTNTGNAGYNWLDVQAVEGDNFYRIRSIGNNGYIKISEVVKVTIGKGKQLITVYPNPVVNKLASVQFSNMEKGTYWLRLISTSGQVVSNQQLIHNGGSGIYPLKLNNDVTAGAYQLEITKLGGTTTNQTIIVSD